jgi:putative transposase
VYPCLKELAKVRRRFGYGRLHVFLPREGHGVNHKCRFRIDREEQLHVRRRSGRKRAPMALPLMPNQRWSLDFVSNQLTPLGRLLRNCLPGTGWPSVPDHDRGR